jgi:DNA polymerase II small subunit
LDKKQITKKAAEYGLMLSSAGLNKIAELGVDYEALFRTARESGEWFINPEYIERTHSADRKNVCEPHTEAETAFEDAKPRACDIPSRLAIHKESDVSGKSTCSGTIEDFIRYFNIRYENTKSVIQERVEYKSVLTIDEVKKDREKNKQRIVCMVKGKRESNKGYRFLDVEDPTGELTVLVSDKNDATKSLYERILVDEVIGMEGVLAGELFIADEMTQPDIPINHARRFADEEVYAAFISDIHVGSYLFLEKEFQSFVDWLNGRGNKRDVAERIKYIFIAGDMVDGIGIYPDQERELTIPDIKKQYEFLAMILEEIPKHIEVIMCMGNHDASRNAEPQPKVDEDVAGRLYGMQNVHICGNPVRVAAHNVEFLMYHGTSMDTIIGSLSGCTYARPESAMVEYLKRRSLVPTYGQDSIAPEDKDYLFIGEIPDVFHCGHVHTNGYSQYRGVTIINSGTFQAKTAYQEKLGHQPTPAIVPVMNLQNHEVMMLDFSGNGQQ